MYILSETDLNIMKKERRGEMGGRQCNIKCLVPAKGFARG